MNGAEQIAEERQRQIEKEGYAPEHDDEHQGFELAKAAECYLNAAMGENLGILDLYWPFSDGWKRSEDPIRNLVKAGALIAAEIDRLERAKKAVDG